MGDGGVSGLVDDLEGLLDVLGELSSAEPVAGPAAAACA